MPRRGKPRNRVLRRQRRRLFFRPSADEAPAYWPRENGELRWASIMSGAAGWTLVGEADLLTPREIKEARLIFGEHEYEDAEFREEAP